MKPTESMNNVIAHLTNARHALTVCPTTKLSFNNNKKSEYDCFILHKGTACVRDNDSGVVLAYITAPFMLGYNSFFDLSGNVYIESVSEISFELIKVVDMFEHLKEEALASEMLTISMYSSFVLYRSISLLMEKDKSRLIEKLRGMYAEEPGLIREQISFSEYVSERTGVHPKTTQRYLKG